MPTLPEEEEGSEDQDRMQNFSPTVVGVDPRVIATPAIVLPDVTSSPDREFDQTTQIRSHSPIQRRSSRNSRTSLSSTSSLTSVDGDGHVYDLVNDELPDVQLSDEDKKKNTELLEEAKKISERFLTRRCRRSKTSPNDSPPALTPSRTPIVSPSPSRSNSVTVQPQIGSDPPTVNCVGITVVPSTQAGEKPPPPPNRDKEMKLLEVPGTREQDIQLNSEKHTRKLSPTRKTVEARKSSPAATGSQVILLAKILEASVQPNDPASLGTDACREFKLLDKSDCVKADPNTDTNGAEGELGSPTKLGALECKALPLRPSQLLVSELVSSKPALESTEQAIPRIRMPCRAEIKSFSSQPLLRAVSWECLEADEELSSPPKSPPKTAERFGFNNVFDSSQLKASNCKDLPAQPKMQKLAKLREENKMMRNQNLAALRLPDLSETIEQDRGPSPTPCPAADGSKGNSDITPNIPDSLLRKLKVHRSLPGGLPPLTEKEIENTFIQLSLAFKNDSYTLEARLGLAERERNLAEENTEKELENFKAEMKSSASLWVNSDRDAQQRLLETITVLQRLAIRLSGRAEMVGAVRQEKRMSKATEVMMQYVENLKRMYEKDHAELTEFKKLANQNSNRNYSPYGDSNDDGVPRTARSMSLTLGKTVPRRRVSVAVVPKFINFPGQPAIATMAEPNNSSSSNTITTNTTTSPSSSSSINPSSSSGISIHSSPTLAPLVEHGKQNGDKENECPTPGDVQLVKVEITSSETKAKIEEEAYNKGYQEGLKAHLSQEQELQDAPEKVEGQNMEKQSKPSFKEERKYSKFEEVSELIDRLCPKCLKHRSVIWIVGAVVLLFAVLISIFTSLHYPCEDLSNTPSGKSSCSSVQKYLWPFSGPRHKNRAQV
ncbi:inositol 1,4,5-triphosphate receptor associated 1 isoform X1 [Carcharodon carcharias]|uniref:inositol 1,4,5-triphosphate receptor associated 1 isoform X1 n=1 Tax=Carcharodon carcharias TaxID=13397 RepID=UPI001B7E3046|nr:inositol 1,4,5-triphosphate receptor associated 1 isoform X1 [Carcharodon carcharias]XP_041052490.1 inositol 1,4,5-triphosphate receptor associated 1 isoform X1 [Carcharodon carcharias]XP_041052491.1 inositol 1,4,5-triphosphate receptor associated 1 isoform X1 [Carcharodon carcharias]